MSFLLKRLKDLSNLVEQTEITTHEQTLSFDQAQEKILGIFAEACQNKHKIFVVGNGGSSGIASHHVIDLLNVVKAPAFSIADSNVITCLGNDYGYDKIFSKTLEAQADKKDILIAISSSGQSKNILNACETMRQKEGVVITLSGFDTSNPLRQLGNINIWTDANDYGLVETAHFFILHTFIDAWGARKKKLSQLVSHHR